MFASRIIAGLLCLLATAGVAEAQSLPSVQLGMVGQLGRPQGALKDSIRGAASGPTVSFAGRLERAPILVGIDLGSLDYELDAPTSSPAPGEAPVEARGAIDLMHLLARIQSGRGPFRPYVDVLMGISQPNFTTFPDGQSSVESNEFRRTAFSYGAGAGVMLCAQHPTRGFEMCGQLQGRSLSGSEAEYVKPGSLRLEERRVAFDTARARQRLSSFAIGLVLNFDF